MPDLTPWIEAQLKRGHTKEEVKKYLAKLGYPASAVAQVDKMKPLSLSNQRRRAFGMQNSMQRGMPKGPTSVLPVVVVGFVAVILLVLTDSFTSQRSSELQVSEKPEQAPSASQPPPNELCSEFEAGDRKACDEITLLVGSKYPGTIEKVERQKETNAFVLTLMTKQGRRLVTVSAAENSVVVKDAATSELINQSTLR
ncbi:hypothetical protein HYU16_04495 [Candidatus Woesearchaeota archaeon]|nr:hypothetical protein [Candidatus Woesearchaeota archaeon]